jgi:hypothetical protein
MPSDGESSVRMAFSARRGSEVSWLWLSFLGRDQGTKGPFGGCLPRDKLEEAK